jgi:hypothetical protein
VTEAVRARTGSMVSGAGHDYTLKGFNTSVTRYSETEPCRARGRQKGCNHMAVDSVRYNFDILVPAHLRAAGWFAFHQSLALVISMSSSPL